MDPLRIYDFLALSRARLFDRVRPLSEEQYTRRFDLGMGTLARTLTHVMISEWYYIERLERRDTPPYNQWPIRDENPPPFPTLEAAWTNIAAATHESIRNVRDWDAARTYRVTDDDGRRIDVTATGADIVTQLALHEIHHRSQALIMLRLLGSPVEGDIDFNALMYTRRPVD